MKPLKTLFLLSAVGATSLSLPVAAQQAPENFHGYHMWNEGWHGWFMGPVMMILILAVVVALVIFLVRWLGSTSLGHGANRHDASGKTPLDILDERFARGEINPEEYRERRNTLSEQT